MKHPRRPLPLTVTCPLCQTPAGQPCPLPNYKGRRRWHLRRNDTVYRLRSVT